MCLLLPSFFFSLLQSCDIASSVCASAHDLNGLQGVLFSCTYTGMRVAGALSSTEGFFLSNTF